MRRRPSKDGVMNGFFQRRDQNKYSRNKNKWVGRFIGSRFCRLCSLESGKKMIVWFIVLCVLMIYLWLLSPWLFGPIIFHKQGILYENHDTEIIDRNENAINAYEMARPVHGIRMEWKLDESDSKQSIEAVYAIPSQKPVKGIVLLLHGCSHSALKFFSPSRTCPECIGLSEEIRISHLVLSSGYVPLAVSSYDRKRGCWSAKKDTAQIEQTLKNFQFILSNSSPANNLPIYAIGASSGGYMAAELASRGLVSGSIVMVMSLGKSLQKRLFEAPVSLYLAPMPRDSQTTLRVQADFEALKGSSVCKVILDEKTCRPIPVTDKYLLSRVPGLKIQDAKDIVDILVKKKHLDSEYYFIQDPTRSNWRELLKKAGGADSIPDTNMLWGKYNISPGKSPLAKAFHRGWAVHEYCSEVVLPGLSMFENSNTGIRL